MRGRGNPIHPRGILKKDIRVFFALKKPIPFIPFKTAGLTNLHDSQIFTFRDQEVFRVFFNRLPSDGEPFHRVDPVHHFCQIVFEYLGVIGYEPAHALERLIGGALFQIRHTGRRYTIRSLKVSISAAFPPLNANGHSSERTDGKFPFKVRRHSGPKSSRRHTEFACGLTAVPFDSLLVLDTINQIVSGGR